MFLSSCGIQLLSFLTCVSHSNSVITHMCHSRLVLAKKPFVLRDDFFLKFHTDPRPRNANNVEPYTFVTLFPGNLTTHSPFHYVTLELALTMPFNAYPHLHHHPPPVPLRSVPSASRSHSPVRPSVRQGTEPGHCTMRTWRHEAAGPTARRSTRAATVT